MRERTISNVYMCMCVIVLCIEYTTLTPHSTLTCSARTYTHTHTHTRTHTHAQATADRTNTKAFDDAKREVLHLLRRNVYEQFKQTHAAYVCARLIGLECVSHMCVV